MGEKSSTYDQYLFLGSFQDADAAFCCKSAVKGNRVTSCRNGSEIQLATVDERERFSACWGQRRREGGPCRAAGRRGGSPHCSKQEAWCQICPTTHSAHQDGLQSGSKPLKKRSSSMMHHKCFLATVHPSVFYHCISCSSGLWWSWSEGWGNYTQLVCSVSQNHSEKNKHPYRLSG